MSQPREDLHRAKGRTALNRFLVASIVRVWQEQSPRAAVRLGLFLVFVLILRGLGSVLLAWVALRLLHG